MVISSNLGVPTRPHRAEHGSELLTHASLDVGRNPLQSPPFTIGSKKGTKCFHFPVRRQAFSLHGLVDHIVTVKMENGNTQCWWPSWHLFLPKKSTLKPRDNQYKWVIWGCTIYGKKSMCHSAWRFPVLGRLLRYPSSSVSQGCQAEPKFILFRKKGRMPETS